jgi:hypothetical protein
MCARLQKEGCMVVALLLFFAGFCPDTAVVGSGRHSSSDYTLFAVMLCYGFKIGQFL